MSWTRPELNLLRQNEAQSSKNWPIRAQRENFAKSVSSFFLPPFIFLLFRFLFFFCLKKKKIWDQFFFSSRLPRTKDQRIFLPFVILLPLQLKPPPPHQKKYSNLSLATKMKNNLNQMRLNFLHA